MGIIERGGTYVCVGARWPFAGRRAALPCPSSVATVVAGTPSLGCRQATGVLPTPPEAWLDLGGVSVVRGLAPRGVVKAWEFAEWVVVVKEGIDDRSSDPVA